MQRTRCMAGVIAAIVLATPWIAEARPKTDRAVFLNGDVLTGEIKSLDRGKLRYSTNAMGTVSIEWDDLESGADGSDVDYGVPTGLGWEL